MKFSFYLSVSLIFILCFSVLGFIPTSVIKTKYLEKTKVSQPFKYKNLISSFAQEDGRDSSNKGGSEASTTSSSSGFSFDPISISLTTVIILSATRDIWFPLISK